MACEIIPIKIFPSQNHTTEPVLGTVQRNSEVTCCLCCINGSMREKTENGNLRTNGGPAENKD